MSDDHRSEQTLSGQPPGRQWLSRNVVVLGIVSLLTDTATEMVVPLLPVFVTGVLGAGPFVLGWIEGLADAVASLLKLVSGRLSDRMGKHRPLVVTGYGVSTVVRPLIALTTTPWQVVAVRTGDRVGKGLRTSPRDALLARSVPAAQHARAFAFHRAMDHAGAVLGPLLAFGFLAAISEDLRRLFWLSAIPGAGALLVLWVGVREVPAIPAERAPSAERGAADGREPGRGALARLLLPLGVFTLGNASDVFLLLKAADVGSGLLSMPLLWLALHVVKSTASVPAGMIADRWGRRRTIALGWLYYAAIYVGFAFAERPALVGVLFVAYGTYHALTEGAERALVAELVTGHRLGGGFGWYHVTLGLGSLAASLLFGFLWESGGPAAAFLTSAGLAVVAVVLLGIAWERPSSS